MSDKQPIGLALPRLLLGLALAFALAACGSPAVVPLDAATGCGPETCSEGCCAEHTCVTSTSKFNCGGAGEVCVTCPSGLADSCTGGECICAGAGYLCSAG